ncbi:MAG: alginate export family protein [Ignavibacteriae bacterium]|nr:alginate export family protein [Ignavibacteriota bacterium]
MKFSIFCYLLIFHFSIGVIHLNILYSQDKDSIKFQLDGNVRYRYEKWTGMNMLNYGDDSPNSIGNLNDNILLQRIILGFNYKPQKNINISFHIQDSRAFGWSLRNSVLPDAFKIKKSGTTNPYYIMNTNEVFFEIYDLNISLNNIIKNTSVKLGRQKIMTADSRIFGPGDWGNAGRWSWDALKVSNYSDKFSLDAWIGGTRTNYPGRTTLPFTFDEYFGGGAYGIYKINKDFTIEPCIARKQQGNADYIKDQSINRNWAGLRLAHNNFYNIIGEVNYVREFGRESGKTISAYGLFLKTGYSIEFLKNKFILSLRYSYATGGNKSDGEIHTFDPVYGAQDKYYGWMNLAKWSNLDDREIVFEAFKGNNLWIEMKYNQFRVPSPENALLNGTLKLNPGSDYLGEEFDIYSKYTLNNSWQFVFLIGVFNPKDVQQIDNKTPKTTFTIGLQAQYNFSLAIF